MQVSIHYTLQRLFGKSSYCSIVSCISTLAQHMKILGGLKLLLKNFSAAPLVKLRKSLWHISPLLLLSSTISKFSKPLAFLSSDKSNLQ